MQNHNPQSAFVLHTRAYRETSLLVELLTQQAGRVCVVAKGAKRPKSPLRGVLQPFQSLLVDWFGRGELVTLKMAEPNGKPLFFSPRILPCGFYLNEILMRVLHPFDACESVFLLYQETVERLTAGEHEQIILRRFEKNLLRELGYELQLTAEAKTKTAIHPEQNYTFLPQQGFLLSEEHTDLLRGLSFAGKHLLAIAQEDYHDAEVLRAAKRLMRMALSPLLGNRPLKSRELFLMYG